MRNLVTLSFLLGIATGNAFADDVSIPATPAPAADMQPQTAPFVPTAPNLQQSVRDPQTLMPVRGVDIMTQEQWDAYVKAREAKKAAMASASPAPSPVPLLPSGMPVTDIPAAPGPAGPPGPPAPPAPFQSSGYVEAGGNFSSLDSHYGTWAGEYMKGEVQADSSNRWSAEALNQREFGTHGLYGDIGNTHTFNDDWYSSVTVGAGEEAEFLPRYRVDAFLNRKWLEQRQLVTTAGVGADGFEDGHKDGSLFLGATYYFSDPWNIQGGVRLNDSAPGGVLSLSEFIAVTQGTAKDHFLTLRYGYGKEAYQVIGPASTISDFYSQQVSLELRQWLGEDWGFDIRGEGYHNPNYNRVGGNLGVFKEF
jgi:YaiO family outer membrane protein